MKEETQITTRLTPRMHGEISGREEELNAPLFAINWFDTRVAALYHLYNHLAASRVFAVGGRIFIKGKCGTHLSGDPQVARQLLLIVNYPTAERFLDLLADRRFQIMSVLRMAASKNFSFVLHRRIGGTQRLKERLPPLDHTKAYAVLHLREIQEPPGENTLNQIATMATHHDVTTHFAGRVAGQVAVLKEGKERDPVNFITDATMVLEAKDEDTLNSLFESEDLRKSLATAQSHFAALLERTL